MLALDFHTHTHHSFDSMMKPEKILRLAKERGLSGIVISDHDTIKGGLECAAKNPYSDLKVYVASEVKTSVGDITGINLKEEITATLFPEVVQQIKNQGGLVLLVHPYHHHKLSEINFDAIDLIEGYNGRDFLDNNMKAQELARKHHKPIVAGSDAHVYSEVANCKTFYESLNDLTKPVSIGGKQNGILAEPTSQLIKVYKKKSPMLLYKWMKWIPKYVVKRMK